MAIPNQKNPIWLNADDAIALLSDDSEIHTLIISIATFGACVAREKLVNHIKQHKGAFYHEGEMVEANLVCTIDGYKTLIECRPLNVMSQEVMNHG